MLGKKQLYPYVCGWRWEVIGGGARGEGGARSGKTQPFPVDGRKVQAAGSHVCLRTEAGSRRGL